MHVTFRRIITLVVLIILLLWISLAWAVTRYRLQPIELPEAPECGVARENAPKPILNDQGQVAGSLKSCAFFWDQGKITVLGEQSPSVGTQVAAINNIGQVVFNSTVYDATGNPQNTYAYVWHKGIVQDLGALGTTLDGKRFTLASDINGSGQVVGYSSIYDDNGKSISHAFLWQDNHLIDLVAGTAYANQSSYTPAINDHAQIVMNSSFDPNSFSIFKPGPSEFSRPLLWQNDKLMELAFWQFGNSDPLFGNLVFFGYAFDINDSGVILGSLRDYSLTEDGSYYVTALWGKEGVLRKIAGAATYGFVFSKNAKINNQNQVVMAQSSTGAVDYRNRILVSLSGDPFNVISDSVWNGPKTPFFDINDQGQVVWSALIGDTSSSVYNIYKKAFVYRNGVTFNLNDLISTNTDWRIEYAYAINNVGQILVSGNKGYALLSPVTKASFDANQDGKVTTDRLCHN